MGYPNHELIPAAILLDNPGITREEFAALLHATNATHDEVLPSARWDLSDLRKEWSGYKNHFHEDPWTGLSSLDHHHQGLHGLAFLLGLKTKESYLEKLHSMETQDSIGVWYGVPDLWTYAHIAEDGWQQPKFRVTTRIPSSLSVSLRQRIFGWRQNVAEGDVLEAAEGFDFPFALCKVERYMRRKRRRSGGFWHTMKVRKIELHEHEEWFDGSAALTEKHPYFDADEMFDFSQESEKIHCGVPGYYWKKMHDRYYLDRRSFDEILPGDYRGYSALILTAEAVRNNAWKLLSYKGMQHLDDFLQVFPRSRERFERAIWDAHTSHFARNQKMTVSDLLRWRIADSKMGNL